MMSVQTKSSKKQFYFDELLIPTCSIWQTQDYQSTTLRDTSTRVFLGICQAEGHILTGHHSAYRHGPAQQQCIVPYLRLEDRRKRCSPLQMFPLQRITLLQQGLSIRRLARPQTILQAMGETIRKVLAQRSCEIICRIRHQLDYFLRHDAHPRPEPKWRRCCVSCHGYGDVRAEPAGYR